MKNQNYKDNKKRNLNFNLELKKFILKSIYTNTNTYKPLKWNSNLKLTEFYKSSQSNSLVSRCVLTGRNKKYHKSFRFSRLVFLKFARNGYISGIRKSSW